MSNLNILIVEVAGIVTSGIVGPVFTTSSVRRAERLRLVSEEQERRRGALHDLIDEAATVLGEGSLNIHEAARAAEFGDPEPPELEQWANRVYVLEQRILLRLTSSDPIIKSLDNVIAVLNELGDSTERDHRYRELARRFDTAQRTFLDEARTALERRDFTPAI